jgi:flagellar hook-associated protein 2
MSGISSGVGLVSGINYQSLITQLVAIDSGPKDIVQSQIAEVEAEGTAFSTLSTELSGIQSIGSQLALPETFQAADAVSSDPNILTATAEQGAAIGSYQLQVAQLVSTQQTITGGFANATSAPVGAGTLTIEAGGGEAFSQTPLAQLNGGAGVQRGQFRITDGAGNSAVIDTSDAVTLDNVINDINSASNIEVKASLSNNGIVLTDTSGGGGTLKVQNLSGGTAASSLGIAGSAVAGVLTGSAINYIGNETQLGTLNDGLGVSFASADQLTDATNLSLLNDGQGVQSAGGTTSDFKVSLANGTSFNVTLGASATIGQVLNAINTAGGSGINATIGPSGQGIELQDETTGSGTFSVTALNGSSAASQLGILGTGTGGLIDGTPLSVADAQFNLTDGKSFKVALGAAQTVGDVLNAINSASGGTVVASVASGGQSIQITDDSGGSGTFSITALNGSGALSGLGISSPAVGTTVNGTAVLAGLDSVLISSLNGGQGIPLGQIQITDRGNNTNTVNLAGAKSLSDVLNLINSNDVANGVFVTASLNSAGTGIQLTDTSGGSGSLSVSDVNSTTAAALGIAGSFNANSDVGTNLQRQFVSDSTLLSSLNGGQGINLGEFTITNSAGAISTINLSQGNYTTVGQIISAINGAETGVTASINSEGNGILLTDNANGSGVLKVADVSGTSAADLNIAGVATGTTINGAYEKTIAVTAADTLSTLQAKINNLGFGVTAQIVNDGSSTNPFRLSLTSQNSGAAGQVIIDGGTTNLNPTTLVQGQDAAVFLGGGGSSQPLLVTSNSNQVSGIIQGVTISLNGASSSPVTLNVTLDPSNVSSDLSSFVEQFNTVVTQIGTYTQFNTNTNQGGLLLGDPTTQQIQEELYSAINSTVTGAGQYKTLADVGITINSDGTLNFDSDTFTAAFSTDPTAVQNLFSQTTTGLGNAINNAVGALTDPVDGVITLEQGTLNTRVQNYTDYYNELNTLVEQQQQLLETQFANLEQNIASLQSQQQVLNAFNGGTSSAASTAASTPAASGSSSNSSSSGGSDSTSGG